MSVILGSERALFDRHIVEAKLNVDDFEITKESELPGAPPQQMGTGWIIVVYKPTGIKRHYREGVVSAPHDGEFPLDPKTNIFKTR